MSTQLSKKRIEPGKYIVSNAKYSFQMEKTSYGYIVHQILGDKLVEIGTVYDTIKDTMQALQTWVDEGISLYITVVSDDDDPQPEPSAPAPLPTATIGQVGQAKQLDRRPFQFRKSPKMRAYSIEYHGGAIVETSFNGVVVAYDNTVTGQHYDIDFSVETLDKFTYVTLWVNRQYHACHVLEAKRDYFLLYSRIDKAFNEKIAVEIVPSVGTAMQEAHFMLSMFRDELIHAIAQAENVPIGTVAITVLEKPAFKVGQVVLWTSKRGLCTETYVISEVVQLASTWYKLQHPYMSNVRITSKAEHLTLYQETKKKAVA